MMDTTQALWDEWFDGQYDLVLCVDKAVEELSKDKNDQFKAALLAGLMEHCAEKIRSYIEPAEVKEKTT